MPSHDQHVTVAAGKVVQRVFVVLALAADIGFASNP